MTASLIKKKIVFLAASPADSARLRLEQEIREIQDGLRGARLRENFLFRPVLAVRTRDLQRALMEDEPQVVHFSGHGRGSSGELLVENQEGKAHPIALDALAELFSLCSHHVECVLLNACYSEGQAEAISAHIPYVVGTSTALDDQAAIAFSIGFYGALGEGKPYEDAYRFGRNQFRLDFPRLPPPLLKARPDGLHSKTRHLANMTRDQLNQLALQYKLSLAHGIDDAETHLALGNVYLALKLYDLAAQHLKKSIDRDPALADAYYLLALNGVRGRSIRSLPIQDVRGLESYLNTALQIDDSRAQYYYLLAFIKEGYYTQNGLRIPPPGPTELLATACDKNADPGETQRLLNALPLLDPSLAAKIHHTAL